MRKWLPAVPILIGLGISASAFSRLPADVTPDWSRVFPLGAGAETMPRLPFVLLFPLVATAVWAGMAAGARVAGRRGGAYLNDETGAKAIARFEPTFAIVVTGVVGLVMLLHVALMASVAGWPDWTMKAVGVVLGLGTAAVGNLIPRVKPNWIVGIRTRATLRDPALWARTHRYFGGLLMLVGIGVAILSLFASHYAFAATAVGLLIAAVLAHWFGRTGSATPATVVLVSLMFCARDGLEAQATDTAARYSERDIEIPTRDIVLPGTLTLPLTGGPFPVTILVAGSGPTNRDGNGPLTNTNLYAQLARQLAARGIASVRWDKRGIGPSAKTLDHTALTVQSYVADVATVADLLAKDSRFSRVFIVGHSEGAMHALLAANAGTRVAGVAMLAPTGRPLAQVLHDQFALQADPATVTRVDSAFAQFIRGDEVKDAPAIAAPVLVPFYRRMFSSMAAYEPARELKAASVPILIAVGEMDFQVTAADAAPLRAVRPDATWFVSKEGNHVFKRADSRDPHSQQSIYKDGSLPIVPELVPALADWIHGAARR